MADARQDSLNYNSDDDFNDFNDFNEKLENSITALQTICKTYFQDYVVLKNAQDPQARYVDSQLQKLNDFIQNIPEGHRVDFQRVMLYSYTIALREYLPVQSRLFTNVDNLRAKLSVDPVFAATQAEYQNEIDQITSYFKAQCKDKNSELPFNGFAALYETYHEKNNCPGLVNLDTMPAVENGKNCMRLKPYRRPN